MPEPEDKQLKLYVALAYRVHVLLQSGSAVQSAVDSAHAKMAYLWKQLSDLDRARAKAACDALAKLQRAEIKAVD